MKRIFTLLLGFVIFMTAPAQLVQAGTASQDQDSSIASTIFIPEGYRDFITKDSPRYHSFIAATNFNIPDGEIREMVNTCLDGQTYEAYYISAGNKRIQLVSPDGTIMTAEILEQYFNGITPAAKSDSTLDIENEIIRLVNLEREKAGVPLLEAHPQLMEIASLKAIEMAELNYVGHESPVYGGPSDFAKHYGYNKSVGENLHGGFLKEITAEAVVNAWMNSEGHRANILNPKIKYTGVGWNSALIYSQSGGKQQYGLLVCTIILILISKGLYGLKEMVYTVSFLFESVDKIAG